LVGAGAHGRRKRVDVSLQRLLVRTRVRGVDVNFSQIHAHGARTADNVVKC
jgi:hypothetical protein